MQSRRTPTRRERATPSLMYRGKNVSRGEVRGGVSNGMGVAPPEDYTPKSMDRHTTLGHASARTMGRFIVLEKSGSELDLERKLMLSRQEMLAGWDDGSNPDGPRSPTRSSGTATPVDYSTLSISNDSPSPSPLMQRRRRRRQRRATGVTGTAGRGLTSGIDGSYMAFHGLAIDSRDTSPTTTNFTKKPLRPSTTSDYSGIDRMVVQFEASRIATPTLVSPNAYEITQKYLSSTTKRASTSGNGDGRIGAGRTITSTSSRLRPRNGNMMKSSGLSQYPPALGYKIRTARTANGRMRSPRSNNNDDHDNNNNNSNSNNNNYSPRTSQGITGRAVTAVGSPRLTEYQQLMKKREALIQSRTNTKWGTHPNHYKVPAASSPFRKPVVLSPRTRSDPTAYHLPYKNIKTIYLDEDDATAPEVDLTLQEGLMGTSNGFSYTDGLTIDNNGTINPKFNVPVAVALNKSKGYSGQLYRGALVPPLSRWYPEKPELLVGNHLETDRNQRAQRIRRKDPKVPVGFFSKRGRITTKKITTTPISPRLCVGMIDGTDGNTK